MYGFWHIHACIFGVFSAALHTAAFLPWTFPGMAGSAVAHTVRNGKKCSETLVDQRFLDWLFLVQTGLHSFCFLGLMGPISRQKMYHSCWLIFLRPKVTSKIMTCSFWTLFCIFEQCAAQPSGKQRPLLDFFRVAGLSNWWRCATGPPSKVRPATPARWVIPSLLGRKCSACSIYFILNGG